MRDRHHILFPRALWDATNLGKDIRSIQALIPRIDREAHTELHREVPMVPVMPHHMGKRVLRMMELSRPNSNLVALDTFMVSVEDAIEHPKANELEKMIGRVVVASIESQKPFVELGLAATVIDLGQYRAA